MVIKKSIIFGIAILVVVAFLVGWTLFPSVDGAIQNWNSVDPDISGQWKTELWITFEDGTEILADDLGTDALSVLFTEPDGLEEVIQLRYKISAKATTGGTYTTAYIDLSEVTTARNIMLAGTTTTIWESSTTWPGPSVTVPVDDQWHVIFSLTSQLSHQGIQDAVEANPYENGYSFGYWIEGGIKFRGSEDDLWTPIDQPALAAITLVAISNEIFLDLSGDVTVIYT